MQDEVMTREEAIIQLKGLKEHCSEMSTQGEIWVDDVNALDMAIKALEQKSKQGHWIMRFNDLFPEESEQECSVCRALQPISIVDDDYCPNCGARLKSDLSE